MAESNNNFNLLSNIYKIVRPADLVGRYELGKFGSKSDPTALGTLLNVFVNTVDSSGSGLLTFEEIVQTVNDLISKSSDNQIKDNIKLFGGSKPSGGVEYFPGSWEEVVGSSAEKSKTKISVTALKTPMLGLSLRDVNRIAIFMNAVPSIEYSRCVPRLEVNFETAFPGEGDTGNIDGRVAANLSSRSPTLLRYLNGVDSNYGSSDRLMAQGSLHRVDLSNTTNNAKQKEQWKKSSYITSGMEIFTAPQTLTTPDSTLAARSVPVLDKFAPLMTIESFEITATPSGAATIAYKTGRLNLIVHDRSRLHEVASLLKPDAYSRTTVSITYGWSHPDISGDNPIADLINQMIVRDEKFNIVNSSFSFAGSGGAKVTLQLATKGASELSIVRIVDSPEYENVNNMLANLSETIRDMREKLGLVKPTFTAKDVRVFQIIDGAADNAELISNATPDEAKREVKKLIDSFKASQKKNDPAKLAELNKFVEKMNEFLNTSKERNDFFSVSTGKKNQKFNINSLLGSKFEDMIGHNADGKYAAAPDPFLDPTAEYWGGEVDNVKKIISGKFEKPRQYVSLAKLMLHYVGIPLQSLGTVDEVQFAYYPLNVDAGAAQGSSLASFPVDVEYFRDVLADHAKRKGNANITIREFMQLLNSTVLEDVRSWAYGMRDFFKPRNSNKISDNPDLKQNKKIEDVTAEMTKRFGGVFRKPVVEMQVESRGGRPLQNGETQADKSDYRIVRIHIYDKQSSAYEPTMQVLKAQQGLQAIEKKQANSPEAASLQTIASQIGLNLQDAKFDSFEAIKRFITQVVPTINYGSNTSGIIAATMQTMQNPALSTVNMQRTMGPQYNSEPNGSAISAIPLRVQPSQLDLTLIGCPLLNLAQQFFIDFNTGTTLDNLYVLTQLSHTIEAGKFQSTAKFTYLDAYGAYESIFSKIGQIKEELGKFLSATKKNFE